jgi:hypothetical protein
MPDDQDYSNFVSGEDEASRLLRRIMSPAEAQSLVLPPPNQAPASGPGESTPLTGNLADPPSQAIPSRAAGYDRVKPITGEESVPMRRGLAGYFLNTPASVATPDRSGDPSYVKVSSQGQIGYLPKANLGAAKQIDGNLKVLDEA